MLEKAIAKIQEMTRREINVLTIGGREYATGEMRLIEPPEYRPSVLNLSSLESVITMVRTEAAKCEDRTIYVHVESHREVAVFTTYDEKARRDYLYRAVAEVVSTPVDRWTEKDDLIIALNSVFIPNEDTEYIQTVLNKITEESKVTASDNGLGQNIEMQKGIALKENAKLKTRVLLKPFRTFPEVEQPESEFILRARDGGAFLIKSADGERWVLDAKKNIKEYLLKEIGDIENVIVMA